MVLALRSLSRLADLCFIILKLLSGMSHGDPGGVYASALPVSRKVGVIVVKNDGIEGVLGWRMPCRHSV